MKVDPDRIWKGAWRWYSEEMLDCCSPLDVIKRNGLTLDEFVCTATCGGALVRVTRLPMTEIDSSDELEAHTTAFRDMVKLVCAGTDKKLVISYDRGTLLQTGTGHFSPIGGYHAASDQVLILDVARFKYPPHWVPLKLVVKSMTLLDPSTKLSRGYLVIERSPQHTSAVLRVNTGRSSWRQFADSYRDTLLARLKNGRVKPTTAIEYMQSACKIISDVQVMDYLAQYVDTMDTLAPEHQEYIQIVFAELAKTRLMRATLAVNCCSLASKRGYKEVASIFLLAQGPIGIEFLPEDLKPQVMALFEEQLDKELSAEVQALRSTLQALSLSCQCSESRAAEDSAGCACCQVVKG